MDFQYLGMGLADWIVLAIYFVAIVAIGIWSHKRVKDMADFFMGGRRFGKVFMMFFAFGAGTSSEQAVTVVAGTWRNGLVGIWWQLVWIFATPFYWIVAPVMRRMRALTTADFFESRYNTSTATLYSIYGMVISIVFLAALLFASGKMVSALTGGELDRVAESIDLQVPSVGWNSETDSFEVGTRQVQGHEYAVLAMTVMFVSYGMAGGLGAAIITDFIQGILTIAFSFLLLPFVFHMIGGFGSLHEQAGIKTGMLKLVADAQAAEALGKEPLTVFFVFMVSLTALTGIVVQPHIMGVCGAGKTEFEGRFGFCVGNFLKRFCTMAWTFTGLACIVWYLGDDSPLQHADKPMDAKSAEFQELTEAEQQEILGDRELYAAVTARNSDNYDAMPDDEKNRIDSLDKTFADGLFGRAAYDILPRIAPGLVGLLMASLLAAAMSSGDAQMVVSSGLFTDNIYRKFIVREASQRHYLWVGRIAGLLIVAIALVVQSTFHDVIDAIKVVFKTPAAIGISLWIGIIWRGWTPAAVWASTLTSVCTWWFVAYNPDVLLGWGLPESFFNFKGNLLDPWQNVAYLSSGVIMGIVVSKLTSRTPEEQLEQFFTLIHTPVRDGEVIESPCTLPVDPEPVGRRMFSNPDIELPRPTLLGLGGFAVAWVLVGVIIWLTKYLATTV